MCFSSISFSKSFLHKTRPKLIDEESGFKNVSILFLFIKQILVIRLNLLLLLFFFYYFFVICPTPKYHAQWLKAKTRNQKMRWKNNKQQIVGTQAFLYLTSLTFKCIWINFQVFVSHASSFWSSCYSWKSDQQYVNHKNGSSQFFSYAGADYENLIKNSLREFPWRKDTCKI